MAKPLKGVITTWELIDNRIVGMCVIYGVDELPSTIHTSPIISIKDVLGIKIAETKNSRYVLD